MVMRQQCEAPPLLPLPAHSNNRFLNDSFRQQPYLEA